MLATTSVGSTTAVCSLSDQVKKYKARSITEDHHLQHADSSNKRGKPRRVMDSLVILCVKVLTAQFSTKANPMHGIPAKFLPEVTQRLPLDLPLTATAPHIHDENFWKRCCLHHPGWTNLQISLHGLTWKQLYMERTIQEALEGFDPTDASTTYADLLQNIRACAPYIFSLDIDQLLSHIDVHEVFQCLPNLTKLKLSYGVKQIGMKYERMLFGMKISDATALSHAIKATITLSTLLLPSNLLDDDLLRMLMTGLIKNATVTTLDLSHNKLTNHGARLLAKLLVPTSVISSLNLCDNQIHAEGGRYLARGLKCNTSLVELNLRLNRLTDEGGKLLLEGLVGHRSLTILNLSSNALGRETAEALCGLLLDPECPLTIIDLSGNAMTEGDATALYEGIERNLKVVTLDLRQNEIPKDATVLVHIAQIIRRNELDGRHA
ncbi:hypothetical protein SPRG_00854 [Saprolegnia parasitica CBS 223.65]|uniref:Uncharacterized protein n=1 Tax=Saprolegnia parasitica (strain CBS 223.65) TaxID=695850 RepID=A0A067CWC6_SAPPC|nr:hypothetical protein SPRG_00854 [Saprolegnia parasitica CBS 223.65]KDO34793.1 hypothetical protein SPRG_00854 [Saprolegnia parasitica CBS 223.65]|eukprot:XP_012194460.1 hypothetical protein SPRG_00854 [Saprolegnia parasitica CBS 223.65]